MPTAKREQEAADPKKALEVQPAPKPEEGAPATESPEFPAAPPGASPAGALPRHAPVRYETPELGLPAAPYRPDGKLEEG